MTVDYESGTFDSANYGLKSGFLEWWDQSACRTTEEGRAVDWFSNVSKDINAATIVCLGCPVREKCLSHALDNNLTHYVFGGLTADERKALKR